ncbi:MAG: hypothetical protein GEV03_09255 [Streptosporangiales bacterium]|nr:hypothetical protein [Streptosporangiales bacterium]
MIRIMLTASKLPRRLARPLVPTPLLLGIVLIGALIGALGGARPALADPPGHAPRHLTTATYNVYLGADLTPIITAPDEEEMVRRAAAAYAQMEKTDFPARAEAIADVLAENPPEIVGLQEVALWRIGPIDGELTTSYDFLDLLTRALAERGLAYRPVATNTNFSSELPISDTMSASFTDRDVIIARTDLPPSRLKISNAQSHTFAAKFVIPTPAGRTFIVPRGWSAVDVKVRGATVRVANTHLEAFNGEVRNLQATELRTALAGSPHPVALVGDLNSLPEDSAGAYGMFTQSGYVDAWVAVHGPEGGFTAGQSADLDNFPSLLDHRVDYVLYEAGKMRAVAADVVGEEDDDRTPAGLWPSDHAGVVATLRLARR